MIPDSFFKENKKIRWKMNNYKVLFFFSIDTKKKGGEEDQINYTTHAEIKRQGYTGIHGTQKKKKGD